jgi:nitroreductase
MDVIDAIKTRRSIRRFLKDTIPQNKLSRVLDAGRLAPSASNRQPWKFIVVQDADIREKLAVAARNQRFISEAPVIIVAVALNPDYIMSCGVPSYAVDVATALDHMMLTAVEEGLGTCWIGAFQQQIVKTLLKIPEEFKVVALLPIGYPGETPVPKTRKTFEEVVCYGQFR